MNLIFHMFFLMSIILDRSRYPSWNDEMWSLYRAYCFLFDSAILEIDVMNQNTYLDPNIRSRITGHGRRAHDFLVQFAQPHKKNEVSLLTMRD